MASGNAEEDEGWQEVKSTKKDTRHPIFQKLCIASGEVNSLTIKQIKERLKTEGLSNRYLLYKSIASLIYFYWTRSWPIIIDRIKSVWLFY